MMGKFNFQVRREGTAGRGRGRELLNQKCHSS